MSIIPVKEARQIYSESDKRMAAIIEQVNTEITECAARGHKLGHFPPGISQLELRWLSDELTLAGYTVFPLTKTFHWL